MWFKRNKKNRIDDLVNTLGPQGDMHALDQELAKFSNRRLSQDERISWHVMHIATAFRRGDREESFARALHASEELPDNAEVAFALGQEFEHRGMIDDMVEQFRSVPARSVSSQHVLVMTRYCYLHSRHEEGLCHVRPLVDAHFELGVADDTFLYIRGLPFATITFATVACFQLLLGRIDDAQVLIRRAMTDLSDHNLDYLSELIDWYKESTRDIPVISPVEQSALQGISIARHLAWSVRLEPNTSIAMSLLNQSHIPEGSHAWLKDVPVLSKAELVNRMGDKDAEIRFVNEFRGSQPLLFEPHWAFEFGFVRYQERLKRAFWKS